MLAADDYYTVETAFNKCHLSNTGCIEDNKRKKKEEKEDFKNRAVKSSKNLAHGRSRSAKLTSNEEKIVAQVDTKIAFKMKMRIAAIKMGEKKTKLRSAYYILRHP